ncbi:MFS transporter [Amycolatopsis taiwanensis]|uniref:Putative proline/betaine transporter n=1 Tax=Amycolatopsis taiwanensis TaxID=342230 RepID=A0A9W6RAW5_9PSEU|nr:MFS transporter [Amycolatopsis taiwanensis]GLY70600.1 MFS transporter [Amycolatopsis taiwanensis]
MAQATTRRTSSPRMVALGSFIGTTIEWYDFFLYGSAAALVFGPLFFPSVSPALGLIAAFSTYAVGFLARPLGALVGGHVGDRIGRKAMLVASLLIAGGATALVGVLPTYAGIGVGAPLLLVLLRLAQGFGVGGEWGGAALVSVESAPARRRGFYGSFTQIGVSAGMLMAAGAFTLGQTMLTREQFLSWGWRVPFLASGLLVIVGLLIRVKMSEPESFTRMKQDNKLPERPLVEVMRTQRRPVWLTTGMRLSQNALYYLYTTFGIAYIARSADDTVGLRAVLVASAISLATVPAWAWLSDRWGRRPLYLFGTVASAMFIAPFFLLADTGNPVLITLGMVAGINLFHDAMYGPQAAFFAELFPTNVRYSGASMGYQFGSVLSGGLAPLIASSLLAAGGGKPWLVVGYCLVLSVITGVCAYLAPETFRASTDSTDYAAVAPAAATTRTIEIGELR